MAVFSEKTVPQSQNLKDSELIALVKGGDNLAFEILMQKYIKKIYNLAYKMTENREDTNDLVQETFLKAYSSLKSFREQSSLSTWLFRITHNLCIDYLRVRDKKKTVALYTSGVEGEEIEICIVDTSPTPEQALDRKEKIREIKNAMSQLMPENREILVLRDVNGLSYEEISDILDISLGTVKSRINRSREKMKKILLKNGNFFSDGNVYKF